MQRELNTLTANVSGKVRRETLDGREYVVVPTVMLTEGVHEGSNGPLYYDTDALSFMPSAWNSKPITLNHPTENGDRVSACSPSMLKQFGVGFLMNSVWDGDTRKLRAEAWLDVRKMQVADPATLQRITRGEKVEVSTGLFSQNVDLAGSFAGKQYDQTVTAVFPDHLALIVEGKGACSVDDGCGINTNCKGAHVTNDDFGAGLVDGPTEGLDQPSTRPTTNDATETVDEPSPGYFWSPYRNTYSGAHPHDAALDDLDEDDAPQSFAGAGFPDLNTNAAGPSEGLDLPTTFPDLTDNSAGGPSEGLGLPSTFPGT